MKKTMMILMIMVLAAAAVFANGNEDNDYGYRRGQGQGQGFERGNGQGQGRGNGQGRGAGKNGNGGMYNDERFQEDIAEHLNAADFTNLGSDEIESLKFMYQEEKLARDVYAELYAKWNIPVFSNISESEQHHMDTIAFVLDAAGVKTEQLAAGKFSDSKLSGLYGKLVAEGKKDLTSAFRTGATVEDLDIADLQKAVAGTENESLSVVYQNLMKGSRNHLQSFVRQLERNGESYTAQYIDNAYLEKVKAAERKREPISDSEYRF